jgi:hypothetical protein
MSETLLDRVEARVRQALTYNENADSAPAVLLWPDRDHQFVRATEKLRSRLPLLTLGELDVGRAQGPAYWLRCAVAGTIPVDLPAGLPILYLPGVGRDDLRAIEGCPRELAPLAELQYRGQWFAHPNGKDWTIRAFLSNRDRGLGLDVAEDTGTAEALLGSFGELLELPMRRLTSQYLDADFLHRLLNPDPAARLLEWLDDPAAFRSRSDAAQWNAFVKLCRKEYDFDPASDGEVTGGRLLGQRQGGWDEVWRRFAQAPERYSGVEARLRKGRPQELFAGLPESWPQDNESAEDNLRRELANLAGSPAGAARAVILKLWEEHRDRRNWVWARLDKAPLAFALEQMQRLADVASGTPAAGVDELARAYTETGWKADDSFLAALRAAPAAQDRSAVAAAATALYRPWLDAHARALQAAIGPLANSGTYSAGPAASTKKGVVTVFVDGLRLDLGYRLAERLGDLDTTVDTALAGLPTVTETAKPIVTPVPEGSLAAGRDLCPIRSGSGARAGVGVLRSLMADRGLQVLQGAETGNPDGSAWTESADIDKRGHDFGAAFVDEIDRELDDIAKRVRLLLEAGWEQVDVRTDHGWLLLPGGLEKIELPAATVEVKKGRCARLKDGAEVSVPTVPWHWDSNVRIALAPGIGCFEANQEYEHGGVSLQECVVPHLRVRAGALRAVTGGAAITEVKWLGLMCRVEFENVAAGVTLDIRALPADATTSVAAVVKETTGGGRQSLHVRDEELEGERAYVVILGRDDQILAQREVVIGVNR